MGATKNRMIAVERHLAAEVRAAEEGHSVRWSDAGACFLVKSDTRDDVTYHITVRAVVHTRRHATLVASCDCPAGIMARQQPSGVARCKHGARLFQRLIRERMARWDPTTQRIIATGELLKAAVAEAFDASDDPSGVAMSGPGIRKPRPNMDDADALAERIKAGM